MRSYRTSTMHLRATEPRNCEQCGTEFLPFKKSPGRFCSIRCKNQMPHAKPRLKQSVADRFWSHVDKSGECWLWKLQCDKDGYGVFRLPDRHVRAQRFSWEQEHGPLSEDEVVRHLVCDNPPCCRPAHLEKGTVAQNNEDKRRKGRDVTGDDHWTRKYPDRMPHGDDHWARKYPERVLRGDKNGMRKKAMAARG